MNCKMLITVEAKDGCAVPHYVLILCGLEIFNCYFNRGRNPAFSCTILI